MRITKRRHGVLRVIELVGVPTVVILLCFICIQYLGAAILFAEKIQLHPDSQAPLSRVVVGISTFGQRVFHMGPTIQNIFAQTRRPDRVIVSVPRVHRQASAETTRCPGWLGDNCKTDPTLFDESQTGILQWFMHLTNATSVKKGDEPNTYEFPGPLTLLFLDQDWGAGTKALGALMLERDPDTILITMDDDMIYHDETIAYLTKHETRGMALSFGCETWEFFHTGWIGYPPHHNIFTASFPGARMCNGWLSGWTAVAYRVGHFGQDVWTFLDTLPRGCFYNDDVWLSGYLARRGIARVYVPGVMQHKLHRRDEKLSLSTIVGNREKYGYPCARALFGQ